LKDMDYEQYGGVPVLGVNGVSVVGHGSSSPKAIRNMILKAVEVAKTQLNTHIEQAIAEAAKSAQPATPA
jgi:phosphate acyltransferase